MASEQADLLGSHDTGNLDLNDEWIHKYEGNKEEKATRSNSCIAAGAFIISIFIGVLIGYAHSTYNLNDQSQGAINDLPLLKQPNIHNIMPHNQSQLFIEPTTNKNKQSTSSPIRPTKNIKSPGSIDDELFVATKHVVTNLDESEAKKLSISVTRMAVDVNNGFLMKQDGPYYGTYSFNYKYPMSDEKQYEINEIRKNCFYIQVDEAKIDYKVIIELEFVKFKLENGFDRILIRSFNDSMIDLPISISGNVLDISPIIYLLEQNSSQSLCIEFQSDESFVDDGYEYNLNIYYDLCQWTSYDQCYMENLIGQKWPERGPMWNGKCGVGIMSKHRTNKSISDLSDLSGDSVLTCSDNNILTTYGPEYCIKRKCVDFDNANDPDWPPKPMPGHAWFKPIEYYNGRGRLDPTYADPFRIYTSFKDNLMNENGQVDLNKLENKLISFAAQIASEHYDENVLKMAINDLKHRNISAQYIGARVLNSLINGRPLVFAAVGDSVTSGHDNMFISTYPIQAQSRLRPFFIDVGNKGATFIARNIAEGGGPNSNSQAFVARSMGTEIFPSLWSKLNHIIDAKDKYDIWYKYGGLPIRKIDIFIWEHYFVTTNDKAAIELDIRQVAAMNGIWGALVPNRGVRVQSTCQKLESLLSHMPAWTSADKYGGRIGNLVSRYLDKMGFVLVYPRYGMQAACEIIVNNNITGNWKKSDDGLPNICCLPDGQKYSYVGFWMRTNWHPNSRGNRVNADMVTYWILDSAISFLLQYKRELSSLSSLDDFDIFLTSKSGHWKDEILESIKYDKYDEFVEPYYCGKDSEHPYCRGVAFGISNQSPFVYNSHGYLNEYILFKASENVSNWKQHIISVGWVFNDPTPHMITEKHGMEGLLDSKGQRLNPDDKFYKTKFKEWKKNSNSGDWDEFEKYIISQGYYLQVVAKIPKYGAGRINIFGGHTGWYCDENNINNKIIHIYANTLKNIKENKNDLGVLLTNSNGTSTECTFQNLKPDTKYVISYVPYNMDASLNSFTVMFIAAY